ncbi:endonuclease III [Candidatus Woesearchaeota archaeon]|nr:endonuclease III [Candidatus Woesearchaeota archaeon]
MASKADIPKIISILKKHYKEFEIPIVSKIAFENSPFKVLISCLLSLRTKDEATAKAANPLFKIAGTPKKLANLKIKKIEKIIKPVNYYKTKAKRIKEISKILVKKYNSKVPDSFEELLKLKGVGRKTANIVMGYGFNHPEALAVDVHVHVISNRLGIVKSKNADETEKQLRKVVPKKYWPIYNELLVGYGQHICKTAYPKCGSCYIEKYCIYPDKNLNRK